MAVRSSKEPEGKLKRLAENTRRSTSLPDEAIAECIEIDAWRGEEVRKAVEKADTGGPFVRDDDATHYLDALARGEDPKPPPTFRTR